jgi:hypothetical protein
VAKVYPIHVQVRPTTLSSGLPWWRSAEKADAMILNEQAFELLQAVYVLLPIAAGLDKFFYFAAYWPAYVAPIYPAMLGVSDVQFMFGVGLLEMIVGLGVAFRPRLFAYALAAWLVAIVINLLVLGNYYDVAARDFALAVGAFALGHLALARKSSRF